MPAAAQPPPPRTVATRCAVCFLCSWRSRARTRSPTSDLESEGLRGQPTGSWAGGDSNVSAWSRPSVVAAHTAVSPGFCTLTRRFQRDMMLFIDTQFSNLYT